MNIANKSQQDKSHLILAFGLLLLFIVLYFFPLNNRPLNIPDETRYAAIPYEMLATGDWVTPKLNGLRYFEKPPLGYWFNATAIAIFGENNFAVRFANAFATGMTTLLIYLFTAKVFANRKTALLAAFIHMTFVEVYILGAFSTLDTLLTSFLTAGIISFYLAVREQRKKVAWLYWSISGISLGLAFLTKGFLAFAVPVLALVPWLIWHRHWKALLVQGWYVVLIAILVILPWGILIHLREGDFWHYFFWVEHIKRFTADNAQHKEPFYFFIMYLPILAFPWISLLPAAMAGLKQRAVAINLEGIHLLWLWLLMPLLFFSISSGKLTTYILPCFPPLSILIAIGLSYYLQSKKNQLFLWGMRLNLLFLFIIATALIISQTLDIGFSIYQPEERSSLVILLSAIVIGILGGFAAIQFKNPAYRLIAVAFLITPLLATLHFAMPKLMLTSKSPEPLFTETQSLIDQDTIVISNSSVLRAVNWYLKRHDVYLLRPGEVSYGLEYADSAHRLVTPEKFNTFLANKAEHPIAIFCRKGCPDNITVLIPKDAEKKSYGKFDMWYIN